MGFLYGDLENAREESKQTLTQIKRNILLCGILLTKDEKICLKGLYKEWHTT